MLPLVMTFNFDLILGSFLTFWGPIGLFCFLSFVLFLLYHVVLSLCGGGWVVFPAIILSQPNYNYGCFVVGVVVVVGL